MIVIIKKGNKREIIFFKRTGLRFWFTYLVNKFAKNEVDIIDE